MSSIIDEINCNPAVAPSGSTFIVEVVYGYHSGEPGLVKIDADVTGGHGEHIAVTPAVQPTQPGGSQRAVFGLKIDLPDAWQPGTYAVELVAFLTEGANGRSKLRRLGACFVDKH